MTLRIGTRRALFFGADKEYADKVLATQPAALIAYWPLWEPSGSVADNYEGTAARDGAYTGVTLGETGIGDGRTCPLFDGANDYVNCYTASFRDAFDGDELTVVMWCKVFNVGVWTDGALRKALYIFTDANNYLLIDRGNANDNRWLVKAVIGGVIHQQYVVGLSETGWMFWAYTRTKAGDEAKVWSRFPGGALTQQGATYTGLAAWAGNVSTVIVGAENTTPTRVFYGYEAHVAIWKTALSQAELEILSAV